MAAQGLDLQQHRSRAVTAEHLAGADLVLAMARRHVREAVLMLPEAWPRTFTLKELVRRGESALPRRADQSLAGWLTAMHAGRRTSALLGDDPADDVEDPIGAPDRVYEATAAELADLVSRLVDLAFAPTVGASQAPVHDRVPSTKEH